MTSEISLAFAELEDRAAADGPRDRISLRDYIVDCEIGAFQSERGVAQRVQFNIVVEVARPGEPIADDVDRILSYDTLTDAVADALGDARLNLLETLAERIAAQVLTEPRARRIFVRIEKLDRGPFRLGVEIVREREAALPVVETAIPRPIIVFLSAEALADDRLPRWLDQLEACGAPLVLTVGASALPVPEARTRGPRRRIDLLAIEQNAWVLAGRDPRCVVVDSRTELDWAAKVGQVTVWAPSKMVLDAREEDAPVRVAGDGLALAEWLSQQLEAQGLWILGGTEPSALGAVRLPLADVLDLSN